MSKRSLRCVIVVFIRIRLLGRTQLCCQNLLSSRVQKYALTIHVSLSRLAQRKARDVETDCQIQVFFSARNGSPVPEQVIILHAFNCHFYDLLDARWSVPACVCQWVKEVWRYR